MKKSEIAQLLLWAQGVDGRTLNELSVEVWHELLGDVGYEAALGAVRAHYRESVVMLKPAHVLHRLRGPDELGTLRDVTAERMAAQQQAWLDARGISLEEFEAHKHDEEWLRAAHRRIDA